MGAEDQGTARRIGRRRPGTAAAAPRKPRADALHNRERLLEAAKEGFADSGAEAGLDQIARRAGVGIGTLYRHFPTRQALIEAVYRREVEHLAAAAPRLLGSLAPGAALAQWMRLFVDYIATKRVVAAALGAGSALPAASGARIVEAMTLLVERARAAREIRAVADADDLLRALVGFTYGNSSPQWRASALRLIDLLVDGLRAPGAAE